MGFGTEAQAYTYFMANVGLKKYGEIVLSGLEKEPVQISLIGFSAGASAVWKISGSLHPKKVKHAICFYGSQIRHLAGINPAIPVEHILPSHEPGFNVDELAHCLSDKANVTVHKTPYLHGFMNELSVNYSQTGYTEYVNRLRTGSVG